MRRMCCRLVFDDDRVELKCVHELCRGSIPDCYRSGSMHRVRRGNLFDINRLFGVDIVHRLLRRALSVRDRLSCVCKLWRRNILAFDGCIVI